ncbi:MAG TPA: hypothetical protein VMD53_01530 [Rhizomicrobium sp.]|nr:hypothetical protein [Rhizomicrobium sp.]
MTKAEDQKVHDLRNDRPALSPDSKPKIAKPQPDGLTELVEVDQPHLATPGIGGTPAGQTTHE